MAVLGTAQLVPKQYEIYDTNKKGYKPIPKEITDNYDAAVQEASKLLARAKTILESGSVQLDVKAATSGNVGQGDAIGVDRGTGGNTAADQQTTATTANVGASSQSGAESPQQAVTGGEVNAKGRDGKTLDVGQGATNTGSIERVSGATEPAAGTKGHTGVSEGSGNDRRSGESVQAQKAAGETSEVQQLQAYVDAHGTKNVV